MVYCPVCKADRDPICKHHTIEEITNALAENPKDKGVYKGKKPPTDDKKSDADLNPPSI